MITEPFRPLRNPAVALRIFGPMIDTGPNGVTNGARRQRCEATLAMMPFKLKVELRLAPIALETFIRARRPFYSWEWDDRDEHGVTHFKGRMLMAGTHHTQPHFSRLVVAYRIKQTLWLDLSLISWLLGNHAPLPWGWKEGNRV